ncbi:hypothetical protein Desdi_1361 [Desulfitobacterium dichloroeliminans LMG P-21439]|uniref:Uncharacterized protein n=1 Tax=Desulfitobacterium dichloroeliminans (strain LMG P-21439 / DCA1) TaxID=871963 RepID=L0F7C7_DESDL|nr:hypothetical protein Desdi_1361 [Desulfitobacterium dichloroeliminans LMG P-21439]
MYIVITEEARLFISEKYDSHVTIDCVLEGG